MRAVPPPELAVVIPTRDRAAYLDVALASLTAQCARRPTEIVVVDDGRGPGTAAVADRHGVRRIVPPRPGLNAARNSGVAATEAPLVAFLDDDVRLLAGWRDALVAGAARWSEAAVFGGPIRARFEGPAPRACGREPAPITTLDLGRADGVVPIVWGANFAVRRTAVARYGRFDETIHGHGDEEDWILALRAAGGRVVYLAAAGVEHRRAGNDARLRALARAAYHRGRRARVSDERRGGPPSRVDEVRVLAGCAWHTVRRACPQGVIMGAQALGRLVQALG